MINTNIRPDGTLEIFDENNLLAEISEGRDDEEFIEDVLSGMGYMWNKDGSVTKEQNM